MITSKQQTAYLWIWLPGQIKPIICGRLTKENQYHTFNYGHSYLQLENAVAIDPIELPLQSGMLRSNFDIHCAIRDAAPDAWGRRVILQQMHIPLTRIDEELTEIDFLLHSNSNRIGAMHFQLSADEYQPPHIPPANLDQLMQAAEKIDAGESIPATLDAALVHGTSIGGARPKAFLNDDFNHKQFIAKFSSHTDSFPIVKAEFAAMQLAKRTGLTIAETQLLSILGKDVLLIERFDREKKDSQEFLHHFMISGLTALQLHEMEARYASYLNLADFICKFGKHPEHDLVELYKRMVFNILIGNTDDHARNHAFFWDGHHYQLTPGYDICPMMRVGRIATQAMQVGIKGSQSTLVNALSACERFNLTKTQAQTINNELVEQIKRHWSPLCELAGISDNERARLEYATILSDYCFEDYNSND